MHRSNASRLALARRIVKLVASATLLACVGGCATEGRDTLRAAMAPAPASSTCRVTWTESDRADLTVIGLLPAGTLDEADRSAIEIAACAHGATVVGARAVVVGQRPHNYVPIYRPRARGGSILTAPEEVRAIELLRVASAQ